MRRSILTLPLGFSLLAATACSDSGDTKAEGTDSGTETDSSNEQPSGDPTDTDDNKGSDETGETGDTGETSAAPSCGDGNVDEGEACDEGSDNSNNGACLDDCTEAACGDGYVWTGTEDCDGDNDGDPDGADASDVNTCNDTCEHICRVEWQAVGSVENANYINGVNTVTDSDGNVYTASDKMGAADIDIWLAKYDNTGTQVWEVMIDNTGDDSVADLALDATGNIAIVGKTAGTDGTDILAGLYAGADGAKIWAITHDGDLDGGDDLGAGVVVAPSGDIIVSGQVRNAAGDDDVWVRSCAAADGAEQWVSTWSGTPDNNFSIDKAGPVAVDSTGIVYVLANEYVDFENRHATLLKFPAAGGDAIWAVSYETNDGAKHNYPGVDVAVASDDTIYIAMESVGNFRTFWLKQVAAADGAAADGWDLRPEDFDPRLDEDNSDGKNWFLAGIDVDSDGNLSVGGYRLVDTDVDRYEGWIARVKSDNSLMCMYSLTASTDGATPPDLLFSGVAAGASAATVASGVQATTAGASVWVGKFRGE